MTAYYPRYVGSIFMRLIPHENLLLPPTASATAPVEFGTVLAEGGGATLPPPFAADGSRPATADDAF